MPVLAPDVLPAGALASLAQPELVADGLLLRAWTPADVPALVAAYEDPGIQRWHVRSMDEPEATEWVRSRAKRWRQELGADWAVTRERVVVGRIALRTLDLADGQGEVSYWVVPAARGAGVAPAALAALTHWCLDGLGLHRLALRHSTQNPASCRVATRAGYALEGTQRSEALHADGWHDMHLHARTSDEGPEPGAAP